MCCFTKQAFCDALPFITRHRSTKSTMRSIRSWIRGSCLPLVS
jgi:hypothetical protein